MVPHPFACLAKGWEFLILNQEILNSTESGMPLAPNPFLATFIKALTRAVLFSLSIDHVLIDFLARTIIEAATGLLAILVVGIRRSPRALRRRSLQLDPDRKST